MDGREHPAGVAVEAVVAAGVADAVDYAASHLLHVHIGLGAHFARHDHQTGGAEGLACHFREGVATQELVEDGVGNLVGNFIGVPFGHRFRCK